MDRFVIPLLVLLVATAAKAQSPQEYAYGPDPMHRLDVYVPKGARNAPMIVMLHGGAWRTGDKRNAAVWQGKVAHWLPQGYIFISVNTRLLPNADPIEQTQDLALAVKFVQRNAKGWGGDMNQMILMGHSAGAHVTALLSTRNDLRVAAGLKPWRGSVLLDTAIYDVESVMRSDPSRIYRSAFGQNSKFWTDASPAASLDRTDPPMLAVCSSRRRTSCDAARTFASKNRKVSVLSVNLRHREINKGLGQMPRYTDAVDQWMALLR